MNNEIPIYQRFISPSQILNFGPNSKFRVYYLESALSILSNTILDLGVINNVIEVNIFHSGIGFQSIDPTNQIEFTFDYNILQGFNATSLIPQINDNNLRWNTTNQDDNSVIRWNNQSGVFLGSYIDRKYWQHSTYVTLVTGKELIAIQNWILNIWNPQNPIYVLFAGIKSVETYDNPIMRSSNCYDFTYDIIDFIDNSLKVCIDYVTVPNITISAFIETFPGSIRPINFNQYRDQIIEFYTTLSNYINNNININQTIDKCINDSNTNNQPVITNNTDALTIYSIENDLFTVIQLYEEIFDQSQTIYLYGYHPNGSLGYWIVEDPDFFISYIKININRSYRSKNIYDQPVNDPYSNVIPTCNTSKEMMDYTYIFLIFFIILIIIIIIIFVYYISNI